MPGSPLRLRTARALAAVLLATAALVACSDTGTATGTGPTQTGPTQTGPSSQPTTAGTEEAKPPATSSLPTTPPPASPLTTWPDFRVSIEPATTERLGATWQPGCPVGADALRLVTMTHATFEGTVATGEIILAAEIVDDVVAAFGELYEARFPIKQLVTMEVYAGHDGLAGRENNSSGFTCRDVRNTGRWSQHAYGLAVDINPLQNPYLVDGEIRPPMGAAYLDRADVRPGMIVEGDLVVQAFTSRGFEWGGRFVNTPDYQHFALPR